MSRKYSKWHRVKLREEMRIIMYKSRDKESKIANKHNIVCLTDDCITGIVTVRLGRQR